MQQQKVHAPSKLFDLQFGQKYNNLYTNSTPTNNIFYKRRAIESKRSRIQEMQEKQAQHYKLHASRCLTAICARELPSSSSSSRWVRAHLVTICSCMEIYSGSRAAACPTKTTRVPLVSVQGKQPWIILVYVAAMCLLAIDNSAFIVVDFFFSSGWPIVSPLYVTVV